VRIYRAVVRGQFADLTSEQAADLRANAADHHFLKSSFTAAGSLTYDHQLVAFNLRFELRLPDDVEPADAEAMALLLAEERLESESFGFKKLRASVTDMASMWK